jgi:hypothetical protein
VLESRPYGTHEADVIGLEAAAVRDMSFGRLYLLTALAGSYIVNSGCQPSVQPPAPDVRFTQSDQDLPTRLAGEIADGGEVEASFSLTNPSKEAKEVVFQGTSCGCTGCFVASNGLKPGDKLTVEGEGMVGVTLRSRLKAAPGISTYGATFGLAEGRAGRDPLVIQSHVRVLRDVALDPGVLSCDFTGAEAGRLETMMRITRTFRAERPGSIPPTLANLPAQVEVLEVAEAEPLTHLEFDLWKQSWTIKFGVKPLDGSANVSAGGRGVVSFAAGPGQTPASAEFPILIHRRYGIESPELSHFGDGPPGERRTRRLVIRSADQRDFEVLRLHTDCDAFSASGEIGLARKSHILEVAFQAPKPGAYEGHLTVETNQPECPTLKIDLAATATADDSKASGGISAPMPKP